MHVTRIRKCDFQRTPASLDVSIFPSPVSWRTRLCVKRDENAGPAGADGWWLVQGLTRGQMLGYVDGISISSAGPLMFLCRSDTSVSCVMEPTLVSRQSVPTQLLLGAYQQTAGCVCIEWFVADSCISTTHLNQVAKLSSHEACSEFTLCDYRFACFSLALRERMPYSTTKRRPRAYIIRFMHCFHRFLRVHSALFAPAGAVLWRKAIEIFSHCLVRPRCAFQAVAQ